VTSAIALLFAAPISIAISIYLTELAPSRLRRPVATLVDMLAAIPTVILGLWGILVLGPFMHDTIEPALQSASASCRSSAATPRPSASSPRR